MVGSGVAGLLTKHTGARDRFRIGRALAVEIVLLGMAAILAAAVTVTPGAASGYIVIALLALAMVERTAAIARFGGADVTLTMLTGALSGLAATLPFTGGTDVRSMRRIAATLALFTGALAGGFLLKVSLWLPLAAATALAVAICVGYLHTMRTHE